MLKVFIKRPNRYVPTSFTYLHAMEMTPPFPPRCALTDVASYEGYNQLLWFGAFVTWFGHNMLVQSFYCPFEAGKLHHGVRDLPQPQWWKTLVKSTRTKNNQNFRNQTNLYQSNILNHIKLHFFALMYNATLR